MPFSDDSVEHAYTICEGPGRRRVRGSEARGGPDSVTLEVTCPHGYRAIAVDHTHPAGNPNPSAQDIAEARRLGLQHICVTTLKGGTQCFRP